VLLFLQRFFYLDKGILKYAKCEADVSLKGHMYINTHTHTHTHLVH